MIWTASLVSPKERLQEKLITCQTISKLPHFSLIFSIQPSTLARSHSRLPSLGALETHLLTLAPLGSKLCPIQASSWSSRSTRISSTHRCLKVLDLALHNQTELLGSMARMLSSPQVQLCRWSHNQLPLSFLRTFSKVSKLRRTMECTMQAVLPRSKTFT